MIKKIFIVCSLFQIGFVFAAGTNFDVGLKFHRVLMFGLRDINTGLEPIKPFASIDQTTSELDYLNSVLNAESELSGVSGFSESLATDRNQKINQGYHSIGKMLTNCLKKDSRGLDRSAAYPEINTWYTIGAWASFTAGKVIASKVDILQVDATCEETKNGKTVNYCFSDKMNHEVTKVFCNAALSLCLVPTTGKFPDSTMVEGGTIYAEQLIDKNYLNSKIILQATQNGTYRFVNRTASAFVDSDVRRWFAAGNFILASELIPIGRHFLREFCGGSFIAMEEGAEKESKRNFFLDALKTAENRATPGHHGKLYLYNGFRNLLEAQRPGTEAKKFINLVAESNVHIGYSEQSRLQKILERALPLSLTKAAYCTLGEGKCSQLATYLAGFTFGDDHKAMLLANGFANLLDKVDPLMKDKFTNSCAKPVVLTNWSNFNQRMSYLRSFFYALTVTNPNNSSSFLNKIKDAPNSGVSVSGISE